MKIKKTLSVMLAFILLIIIASGVPAFAAGIVTEPTPVPTETSDVSGGTIPVQSDNPPVITKDPTGETIYEGGEATFIANASNATSVKWFLYNPATGARTALAGGTTSLTLSNVPLGYNGCMVLAEFSNAAGTVQTAAAPIRVVVRGEAEITEIIDPDATPAPTPTPTPKPTPTPTPTSFTGADTNRVPAEGGPKGGGTYVVGNSNNTNIGTTTGAEMPESNLDGAAVPITDSANGTASGGTAKNSHIGAYILAAVAGLVIVGSILVMVLYMRGKLSLGKFEQFLGGDQQSQSNDTEDEFYNPDDFKDNNKKL